MGPGYYENNESSFNQSIPLARNGTFNISAPRFDSKGREISEPGRYNVQSAWIKKSYNLQFK